MWSSNTATSQEWSSDFTPHFILVNRVRICFSTLHQQILIPWFRMSALREACSSSISCALLQAADTSLFVLHLLTCTQKNKRLKEEPFSLVQTCRQHEPKAALPGANSSCTTTKLFAPIQKHQLQLKNSYDFQCTLICSLAINNYFYTLLIFS